MYFTINRSNPTIVVHLPLHVSGRHSHIQKCNAFKWISIFDEKIVVGLFLFFERTGKRESQVKFCRS